MSAKRAAVRHALLGRITGLCAAPLVFANAAMAQPAANVPHAGAASSATGVTVVVVTGRREQYRGDVPIQDLPQNVRTLSGRLLADLDITRLDSALDLVAGVARQNNFGGIWDAFAIRGFAGDENVPSGFLVNGFNGGRGFAGPRDVSNVERIDVLKGPSSALFGRGEPGGTVNIITKKPSFTEQGGVFSASVGSYAAHRVEGDVTAPINDAVAARLNGAYESADSFRDTLHSSKSVVTPSVLVKLDPKTTISEELQIVHQEVPFDRGIPAFSGVLGAVPNSRFLGEPGDGPNRIDAVSNQIELEHRFDAAWTLLLGFGYLKTTLKGFGQDPEFAAARNSFFATGQVLARRRIQRDYHSADYVPRGEISGRFSTFGLVHHVLIGADYEDFDLNQVANRYRPPVYNATTTLAQSNAVNVFNPVYGYLAPVAPYTNKNEKDRTGGVYLNDQIDLSDHWKLKFGVRFDDYRQTITDRISGSSLKQLKTATSPTVGLVYAYNAQISFYANYATGFRPNTGFSARGAAFQPETTRSYEAGAKYQSLDGALNGSVALFKTEKTNILTADPVNAGFSITAGSAESRGVEVEADGRLPGAIRFHLSYSYLDAFFTTSLLDPDFSRPITPGTRLINIPAHSGDLLIFRDLSVRGHNLSLGANVNYVSDRVGETGTSFELPSYTLVKLIASYDLSKAVRVTATVSNLFDQVYYPSSYAALWVNPGAPRQYDVRVTYRF